MATGFTITNSHTEDQPVDIDDLFEPRQVGDTPPTTVPHSLNNVSISDRYINVSQGQPLPWLTGLSHNGVDYTNLFAAAGTISRLTRPALWEEDHTLTYSIARVPEQVGTLTLAIRLEVAADGTSRITRSHGSPTPVNRRWLPVGATAVDRFQQLGIQGSDPDGPTGDSSYNYTGLWEDFASDTVKYYELSMTYNHLTTAAGNYGVTSSVSISTRQIGVVDSEFTGESEMSIALTVTEPVRILTSAETGWAGTYTNNVFIGSSGLVTSSFSVGTWWESIFYSDVTINCDVLLLPNGDIVNRSSINGTLIGGGPGNNTGSTVVGKWYTGSITQPSDYERRIISAVVDRHYPSGANAYGIQPVNMNWIPLINGASGTQILNVWIRSGGNTGINPNSPHDLESTHIVEIRRIGTTTPVGVLTIKSSATASP